VNTNECLAKLDVRVAKLERAVLLLLKHIKDLEEGNELTPGEREAIALHTVIGGPHT
jgi:hypothetical protein